MKKKNVVVLCAGTGGAQLLKGLKYLNVNLSAVVNVTDNGGSSKLFRDSLSIPQIGDARRCLSALAPDNGLSPAQKTLHQLLNYRFSLGRLSGMSLGNAMLAGILDLSNKKTLSDALESVRKIFHIQAHVFPVTNENVNVCARLAGGEKICGEWEIIKRKSPAKIQEIYLDKPASAYGDAVKAIQKADLVVVAPGSFYTGIVPIFLMKGIGQALSKSSAKKIWVANIMSQPALTDSMTISDHIKEIERYGRIKLNATIINTGHVSQAMANHYAKFGSKVLKDGEIPNRIKIMRANLIETRVQKDARVEMKKSRELEKWRDWTHCLRHDPKKCAKAISVFL